eukprot:m.1585677 g.1585677  ORF g.1585677 m.1585677 type:complete len:1895 (+) comp25325_c0_seq8:149-5833(+)
MEHNHSSGTQHDNCHGSKNFTLTSSFNFTEALLADVAVCRDVVLTETINIRNCLRAARAHSDLNEVLVGGERSVYERLDECFPLPDYTENAQNEEKKGERMTWIQFAALHDTTKPCSLKLLRASGLIMNNTDVIDELKMFDHVFSDDLVIKRLDGQSSKYGNPFEPMRLKAVKLAELAKDLEIMHARDQSEHLDAHWTKSISMSLVRVQDHYIEYARMVCNARTCPHGHYSIGDLLLRPEDTFSMATIGGVGIPYMLVSQKQVALLTNQDTIGYVKASEQGGTHLTYAADKLFFKSANFGDESSLGPIKEHAMFVLAQELFGRGVAETRAVSIHRQLTIDTNEGLAGRKDAPQLLQVRGLRADTLMEKPECITAVQNNQKLVSRHLQVAVKVVGKLLKEVVHDAAPTDNEIKGDSLSEAVFLSLLSMADDAKGDNFIVNGNKEVIGVDNDHVLGYPYTVGSEEGNKTELTVNIKNFFFANQAIVDTKVHPNVLEVILNTDPIIFLTKWLGKMNGYMSEVAKLEDDGALPTNVDTPWINLSLGNQAIVRMAKIWERIRSAASDSCVEPTHGSLLEWALPQAASFYLHLRRTVVTDTNLPHLEDVYGECASQLSNTRKVLAWTYYQVQRRPGSAVEQILSSFYGAYDQYPELFTGLPPGVETDDLICQARSRQQPGDTISLYSDGYRTLVQCLADLFKEYPPASLSHVTMCKWVRQIHESFHYDVILAIPNSSMFLYNETEGLAPIRKVMLQQLQHGETDGRMLSWSSTSSVPLWDRLHVLEAMGAILEVAIRTIDEDAGDTGTDVTTVGVIDAFKAQLKWLLEEIPCQFREDLPVILSYELPDVFFQKRTVLSASVMACSRQRVTPAHVRFAAVALPLLIEANIMHISHMKDLVQFRSLLPTTLEVADATQRNAMLALKQLCATNRELSWQIGVMETLPEASKDEPPHITLCDTFATNKGTTSNHVLRAHDIGRYFPKDAKSHKRTLLKQEGMHGRRTVLHLKAVLGCDICVKIRPELAGVERMVRLVARGLFGDDAAPYEEFGKWRRADFKGIMENDQLLISEWVSGVNLHTVLNATADTTTSPSDRDSNYDVVENGVMRTSSKTDKIEDTEGFQPDCITAADAHRYARVNLRTIFDERGTSVAVVMAMLTMPEDGKPDNYVCEVTEAGKLRIVCVDNDHAFVPAEGHAKVYSRWRNRTVSSKVKCALFCLDQMNDRVDPFVYEKICRADFSVVDFVEKWLTQLEQVHDAHSTMESSFPSKKTGSECVEIVPLNGGSVMGLCNKLLRIQEVLGSWSRSGENKAPTHMQLLAQVEPSLERRYRAALLQLNQSPWQRFYELDGSGFRHVVTGGRRRLETLFQSSAILSAMVCGQSLNDKKLKSPADARVEFDEFKIVLKADQDSMTEMILASMGDTKKDSSQVIGSDTAVERLLRSGKVQGLSQAYQQRLLTIVGESQLSKIEMDSMVYLTNSYAVKCISSKLTSLHIINCTNVEWQSYSLFSQIIENATSLCKLHIEKAPTFKYAAQETGTIRSVRKTTESASLRRLIIKDCALLAEINITVTHDSGCLITLTDCPVLAKIDVHGNSVWTVDSVSGCPKLPDCRKGTSTESNQSKAQWDLLGSAILSSIKFGDTAQLIKASLALKNKNGEAISWPPCVTDSALHECWEICRAQHGNVFMLFLDELQTILRPKNRMKVQHFRPIALRIYIDGKPGSGCSSLAYRFAESGFLAEHAGKGRSQYCKLLHFAEKDRKIYVNGVLVDLMIGSRQQEAQRNRLHNMYLVVCDASDAVDVESIGQRVDRFAELGNQDATHTAQHHLKRLANKQGNIAIVATKTDMAEYAENVAKLKQTAKKYALPFYSTSAKHEKGGVKDMFLGFIKDFIGCQVIEAMQSGV